MLGKYDDIPMYPFWVLLILLKHTTAWVQAGRGLNMNAFLSLLMRGRKGEDGRIDEMYRQSDFYREISI